MTEPYTIQQEVQQLQRRYNTLKDLAKVDIRFLLSALPVSLTVNMPCLSSNVSH